MSKEKQANADFVLLHDKLEQTTTELKSQVDSLESAVHVLSLAKSTLQTETDELNNQVKAQYALIEQGNETLLRQNEDFKSNRQELSDLTGKIVAVQADVNELNDQKLQIIEDIDAVEAELERLHNEINALDAQFKAQKDQYNKELRMTYDKLQLALQQLKEAQEKDKDIRQSWADNLREIENREKVIRKRELRISSDESEIQNRMDFMKL